MLRIPHCLDSRLAHGGKVVSPTHRPLSTPHKHYFSALNKQINLDVNIRAALSLQRNSLVRIPLEYALSTFFFFFFLLILPAGLDHEVHSASNRNEYQKQKNNVSGE
jgi:hypothetical protein